MRYSKLFGRTSHQLPSENFETGQKYLMQSGGAHFSQGEVFLLPLGKRSWNNTVNLVRSEMKKIGVQEFELPLPLSDEKENGSREYLTEDYVKNFLLELSQSHLSSYRDLPVRLAKGKLVKETSSPFFKSDDCYSYFIYSIAEDEEKQEKFERKFRKKILVIVSKLGLREKIRFFKDKSDGTSKILAETNQGEDEYFHCRHCNYTAPKEIAESLPPDFPQDEEEKPLEKIHGPDLISVEELADFADIDIRKTTKTLIFESSNTDRVIAVMVRENYDVSEEKLKRVVGEKDLFLTSSYTIREVFGTEVGYLGVVDLPEEVELVADLTTKDRVNFECGANETDHHFLNVNFGRDLPEPDEFYDVREVEEGEVCPECGEGELELINASPVADFNYFSKKSEEAKLSYAGKDGNTHSPNISFLNLFPSTLFALILEKHHDENGLNWPKDVTPFKVHLLSLGNNEEIKREAKSIYKELRDAEIKTLWDDREKKAGVKFNDADLLGVPVRLVIGEKSYQQNRIEWKERGHDKTSFIKRDELVSKIKDFYF